MSSSSAKPRVFVNCPFTAKHRPIFDAVIFSLVRCDFTPITAPHRRSDGTARLEYITAQIRSCELSIHDITPVGGRMPRYNMAFELGLCLGADRRGDCLIFADRPDALLQSFSDLRGLDITAHGGKSEEVARKIVLWLGKHLPVHRQLPSPASTCAAFIKFREPFAVACRKWGWQEKDDLSARVRFIIERVTQQ